MDPLILGKDVETGAIVSIAQHERRRGLYVIGKTGTAKTTLLINLILQDIAAGLGVCFLDPHGDAISDILMRLSENRENDVIFIDLLDTGYPVGLNPYECRNPQDVELVAQITAFVMQIFEKLWDVSRSTPRIAQYLRNCTLTLIENPGMTMAEIPLLLTDDAYRQHLLRNVTNLQVQQFWRQYTAFRPQEQLDRAESTLNKVDEFLSQTILRNVFGQAHTTLDFRQVMDEGKILLVKLPGRYEDITSLIGSIIIGQLLNAALSRADMPEHKRRQFNLYVDEFQRFSTPDMATLLVEARKYAICSCIAHQFRGQLDQANQGATLNAASMVVFRVSGEDAEELAREFDCTPPSPDIIGFRPILTPKQNVVEHLVRNGHTNEVVNAFVQTYLAPAENKRAQNRTFSLYSKGFFIQP
jgi:Type IV secretion-system coupling protein DNA-binding domain